MLAGFFMKPLQGSLFILLGYSIMGYKSIQDFIDKLDTPLKELVGDKKMKVVSNSPANFDITNRKQTYLDVLHKKKDWGFNHTRFFDKEK